MKLSTIICLFNEGQLTPDQRDTLKKLCPAAFVKGRFSLEEPGAGSPLLGRVRDLLESWGFKPPPPVGSNFPREYWFAHKRFYEATDFAESAFLVPMGEWDSDLGMEVSFDSEGKMLVPRKYFRKKNFIDAPTRDRLLVSSDIRSAIEAVGLRGMIFREARPKGRTSGNTPPGLWELTAEIVLPPLSPDSEFYDREGNRVRGSSDVGYAFREGFFQPPEFHYRSADVEGLLKCDFARTYELIGDTSNEHDLIVSGRFYQFCKSRGLDLYWIPVRVDPS